MGWLPNRLPAVLSTGPGLAL